MSFLQETYSAQRNKVSDWRQNNERKKARLIFKNQEFFVESKIELKKIVWPTQKTVWKNTGIVLAMIFIMGVFVALLDEGFLQLLRTIMTVSNTK